MSILRSVFITVIILVVITGCGSENTANPFKINLPEDPELRSRTEATLPVVLKACPGLNNYSNDFSVAEVSVGSMRDYEGGIEITFTVVENPRQMPSSIRSRSMGHTCYINVKPDTSKIYIAKTGCHSICDGIPHENDPGLMGREISLK